MIPSVLFFLLFIIFVDTVTEAFISLLMSR